MATYTLTDGQNQSFSLLYSGAAYAVSYNTIDASGTATIAIYVDGQENNTINLAPNARISTTITTSRSSVAHWDIKGDATSLLIASGVSDLISSTTSFYAPVGGDGTFLSDTSMNVYGPVASGVTFEADGGTISLFNDATFSGNITLRGGTLNVLGTETITDYSYVNGVATFYGGADDHQIAAFHLTDGTPGTSPITFGSGGGPVTVQDGPLTSYETALPEHVVPVVSNPPSTTPNQPTTPVVTNPPTTQPTIPDNQPATMADGSTGQQMTCPAASYNGPVKGLEQQIIAITQQSLNILAHASNLFIHTGSGNDAVQAHSGVNVLDGGTGSNFLTGAGNTTFFVDARHAAADIWSTVRGFQSGSDATVWGISAASGAQWADAQGAAGSEGLTLHADKNSHTASLTLAGFNTGDLASGRVSAQYGFDPNSGSNFLHLHVT